MDSLFVGDVLFIGIYSVYMEGGLLLSLLRCKNPLHLFQHGLIENAGDVVGMTFEDLSQAFTCRLILFWVSLDVDFVRIAHLPRACLGPFLPSHGGLGL